MADLVIQDRSPDPVPDAGDPAKPARCTGLDVVDEQLDPGRLAVPLLVIEAQAIAQSDLAFP